MALNERWSLPYYFRCLVGKSKDEVTKIVESDAAWYENIVLGKPKGKTERRAQNVKRYTDLKKLLAFIHYGLVQSHSTKYEARIIKKFVKGLKRSPGSSK